MEDITSKLNKIHIKTCESKDIKHPGVHAKYLNLQFTMKVQRLNKYFFLYNLQSSAVFIS